MIVKTFGDGSYLEYSEGNFDKWCVYMVNPNKGFRNPPKDIHYFGFLQKQSSIYGAEKIYQDFVTIYNLTGKQVESAVLDIIDRLAASYGDEALAFSKIFTILYMAMLAEENKKQTHLGKRIKRLGMHQLLIEGRSVDEAANFMRGMNWHQIDILCKERGF